MIYYNRGVEAVYHGCYAEAVSANCKALLLDSANATARGNLLATVNNWALALAEAGRFTEAEQLLAAGHRFAPEHLPFVHNAERMQRMQAASSVSPTRHRRARPYRGVIASVVDRRNKKAQGLQPLGLTI